jgi:hypothetical protein
MNQDQTTPSMRADATPRGLIGPELLASYFALLKVSLAGVMAAAAAAAVSQAISSNGDWAPALATMLGVAMNGAWVAAGVVTAAFALLERSPAMQARIAAGLHRRRWP